MSIEKPLEVIRAVRLLYISLAIGFVSSLVMLAFEVSKVSKLLVLFFLLLFFGLSGFFVFKISKGKNSARILFLVLFLLGVPFAIPNYINELRNNFLLGILSILIAVLQSAALYLLFKRSSNSWFKALKQERETEISDSGLKQE